MKTDSEQKPRQPCRVCKGFGTGEPGTVGYACVIGRHCRPIGHCDHCRGTGHEPGGAK